MISTILKTSLTVCDLHAVHCEFRDFSSRLHLVAFSAVRLFWYLM